MSRGQSGLLAVQAPGDTLDDARSLRISNTATTERGWLLGLFVAQSLCIAVLKLPDQLKRVRHTGPPEPFASRNHACTVKPPEIYWGLQSCWVSGPRPLVGEELQHVPSGWKGLASLDGGLGWLLLAPRPSGLRSGPSPGVGVHPGPPARPIGL